MKKTARKTPSTKKPVVKARASTTAAPRTPPTKRVVPIVRTPMPTITLVERIVHGKAAQKVQVKVPGMRTKTYAYYDDIPYDLYLLLARRPTTEPRTTIAALRTAHLARAHATPLGTRPTSTPPRATKAVAAYDAYLRRVQQHGSLSTSVASGVTSATFDPLTITPLGIRKLYEQLLGPLVLDKTLLDLVIQNADKMRHRFQYRTLVRGVTDDNKTIPLAEITDYGNRTPEQYLRAYVHDYARLVARHRNMGYSWNREAQAHLGLAQHHIKQVGNGTVTKVTTHVAFARGGAHV